MLDPFIFPTKRPTPAEFAVIVVVMAALFIIGGVVALVVAFLAPTEKQQMAAALADYGWRSLILGILIAITFWWIRRFRNSA